MSQPKISVCIPSRGHVIGLWATIHACACVFPPLTEYVVVVNGKEMNEPYQLLQKHGGGRVRFVSDSEEPLPPPIARNLAADAAAGDYLFFLDDHCIPAQGFPGLLLSHLRQGKPIVHSSYATHLEGPRYYHFLLDPRCPVKGDYSRIPADSKAYRVAAAPSGGFAVVKEVWKALDGMDWFWKGFGGEEPYFDLKAWLVGYEVWLEPNALYYHFSCRPQTRGYDKTFNEENFKEALAHLTTPVLSDLVRRFRETGVAL